jgi:hypothetical protein
MFQQAAQKTRRNDASSQKRSSWSRTVASIDIFYYFEPNAPYTRAETMNDDMTCRRANRSIHRHRICAGMGIVLVLAAGVGSGPPAFLVQREITKFGAITENNNDDKPMREMAANARKVLERYMELHSIDQLRLECSASSMIKQNASLETECPDFVRRKFAVGFYSCPHQAGNRLHHFMNAMAWAIVTNRTLLWKYYDRDSCERVGRGHPPEICLKTATRDVCEKILRLKKWIPSLDEWHRKGQEMLEAPFWTVHSTLTASNKTKRKHPDYNTRRPSIDSSETSLLHFGQLLGNDFARVLSTTKHREHLLQTQRARVVAQQLLNGGSDFLYGMLFDASFSFSDSLLSSIPEAIEIQETTYALHSRHSSSNDDGSNVSRDMQCLRRMLLGATQPCRVFVISDRPNSVDKISQAVVRDLNCAVSVVNHTEMTPSFTAEHGPFAGAGFFRDLALASRARHGLVGGRRSSTILLEELIVFHKLKDKSDDGPFVFCDLGRGCTCETVVGDSIA